MIKLATKVFLNLKVHRLGSITWGLQQERQD